MAEGESASRRLEERRPLSPHLQIYRPTLTMAMSMAHRISGAALYFGMAGLVWYFGAMAAGSRAFACPQAFFSSFVGLIALFVFTWALFHHFLGGLRHAIWDAGYGFGPKARELLAQATLFGGVGLTVLVFLVAWIVR